MVREPLFHFLLIGFGIYGLYGIAGDEDAGALERTVTVTAGQIRVLTDRWQQQWKRAPTEAELAGMLRDHVRVQVLHREALAMELDVGDVVIQRRLAQKVERMARGLSTPDEPSEDELRAWHAENLDRFKQPDLYSLTHVYFSPDERGRSATEDARAALVKLNALEASASDHRSFGDRFMLQDQYRNVSEAEIRNLFGSVFARALIELEPGPWYGPIRSGYGLHLVRLDQVILSPTPSFSVIRAKLREAWTKQKIEAQGESFIEALMARYEIIIEEADSPISSAGRRAAP